MSTSNIAKVIANTGLTIHQAKTGLIKKPNGSTCCVSIFCHLLPGILTTVASIVGLIVLNVFQYHYFSIACAIGSVSGGFTIYQAHYTRQLRGFDANNNRLEDSIVDLREENTELKNNNSVFAEENKRLNVLTTELTQTSEALQQEKITLSESNTTLQANIVQLESIKKDLEEKANAHVNRLEALQGSLSGIQQSTEKDHTQFAQHVESFIAEVKKLQATSAQFDTTFEKTAQTLQEIFIKINQWKDDKYHEHLIQTQQSLSAQLHELEKQIARNEALEQSQQKNLEELSKIKNSFEKALNTLQQKSTEIENTTDKFQQVMQQRATSHVVNEITG